MKKLICLIIIVAISALRLSAQEAGKVPEYKVVSIEKPVSIKAPMDIMFRITAE